MELATQITTLFVVILFSIFIYFKILNHKILGMSVVKILCGIIYSGIMVCCIVILKAPMPYSRFAIMILASAIFWGTLTREKFELALTANIISTGISYGIHMISTIISVSFLRFAFGTENDILIVSLSVSMQCVFIIIFFRIKRFRKGMLFLQKRWAGIAGLVICGLIIFIFILLNRGHISAEIGGWFLAGVALCIIGLVFWWRHGLTKLYRERIRERNAQEYEQIIKEKNRQIERLQEDNNSMAKLIHRDNKLLRAMHEAVSLSIENGTESKRILSQIDELMKERIGIITQSQRENKVLPTTKDILIDGIMNHMLLKASEEGIEFDIVAVGDIAELTDTVISGVKLETLFADLIENAIISTSGSEYKQILITFGTNDSIYELNVQDSGIPFEIATLLKLGKTKASTHLHEGGSGIGYMTVFEILHECRASLIITEYDPKPHKFTKSVSVRFDGKNEYIVRTYRVAEIKALNARINTSEEMPKIISS